MRPPRLPARTCQRRPSQTGLSLALALTLLAAPAHAGRPYSTDDAGIVGQGACQLEAWTERSRNASVIWLNPGCTPFGSTEFAFGAAHHTPQTGTDFLSRQWQVKHRLRAYDAGQAGFAIAIGGQHVRQAGERHAFLNSIASLPLYGEAHLLHLNLGLVRLHGPARPDNRLTWGLALDSALAETTRAAVETFGTSGGRPHWQLNIRHELVPGRLQIDMSVRNAWRRWGDSPIATLGLVFVGPAF